MCLGATEKIYHRAAMLNCMRVVRSEHSGCFGGCGMAGCVLMVAALFLPVAQCFGGGSMSGIEALPLLPLLAVSSPGGLLMLYINAAAIAAFLALVRGKIHGSVLTLILPAAILSWFGVQRVNPGHILWAAGVTILICAATVMFATGDVRLSNPD